MNRGLALIHVEACAGDLLCIQCVDQSRFVDYGPPRRVDEDRAVLHQAELSCAEKMVRLLGQGHVHGDEVGLREQPVQVNTRSGQLLLNVGLEWLRVVIEDAHVEAFGAVRNASADAADADEAKRGIENIGTEHHVDRPPLELPLAREVVSLDHPPCRRHQEGECEIRRGVVEHARRVRDHYLVRGRSGKVDVVETDRDVADDLQARTGKHRLANWMHEEHPWRAPRAHGFRPNSCAIGLSASRTISTCSSKGIPSASAPAMSSSRCTPRAKALSFIFLRTVLGSTELKDLSGLTSAQAMMKPHISSTALRALRMFESRGTLR